MERRIVLIWFPQLMTDWMLRRQQELKGFPFALALTEKGRRVVKAVNDVSQNQGVYPGMVVADCKALVPDLQVFDYDPQQPKILLTALAEWCIRYTPFVSIDETDGLILDASGCTHLWGGEEGYLQDIHKRFKNFGYHIRTAIAETIGCAWAVCHYSKNASIITSGKQNEILSMLPSAALRLETNSQERLEKLGLKTIGDFIQMPRTALRRRFGQSLLMRLDQALGLEMEMMTPVKPPAIYEERLPSLEPIRTATGIEIALKVLLEALCERLNHESKGLRKCELRCYRLDGNIQRIDIGTNRPTRNVTHLFKLFEIKIAQIDPDLGIELFILEASIVEELFSSQDALWTVSNANEVAVAELIDKLAGKIGSGSIHRYLPAEHYWPEKSVKESSSLTEKATTNWRTDLPRPLHLLPKPEQIEVSVPVPDYPPLLFRYQGVLHNVKKADGPERIGQEWWTQQGLYRDYYCVEDELGARYWVFRSGDYSDDPKWFIHGFFA
ncbi:MAG: nucleotidyltransferase [Bacteroidetes bacterium]|jgi:protein ImuB|nr:nucleotidyltransferase [Bacteroidota bacterium]MDF2450682.1 nucleotidyltransferase [Bacteroidota bacterium]